jgi:hypothetical protein
MLGTGMTVRRNLYPPYASRVWEERSQINLPMRARSRRRVLLVTVKLKTAPGLED